MREDVRTELDAGALDQLFRAARTHSAWARPASDGRPAATDLRPHEVGPDERQLEPGTHPLPPEPRGEGAARAGAGAAERREDAPRSGERRVGEEGRSRWSPYH